MKISYMWQHEINLLDFTSFHWNLLNIARIESSEIWTPLLNARNLDSLLYSLFCLPIVTKKYVVIVCVYLQKEHNGNRLV